jgi:hypothetical protein
MIYYRRIKSPHEYATYIILFYKCVSLISAGLCSYNIEKRFIRRHLCPPIVAHRIYVFKLIMIMHNVHLIIYIYIISRDMRACDLKSIMRDT